MEIVLVRHAEPDWVQGGRTAGDPGLTPLGQAQARAVASHLMIHPIDQILVSPARRAQETVAELERASRLTASIIPGLNEIHVPFDDTPSHVVEEAFQAARNRPLEEWWAGIEGGETFRDFHFRVTDTIEAVLRQRGLRQRVAQHLWDDSGVIDRLVIVAHRGTNALITGHLLGLEAVPWEWERFVSNHAGITRIRTAPLAGAHVMALREHNGTSHLAQEYLTI